MNTRLTIEQVNEATRSLNNYFVSIGLNTSVSQSRTSFGASNYIYVDYNDGYSIKIRISDHTVTNSGRIMDELHYFGFNHNEIIDTVEYAQYPERFAKADYVSMSDIYIATVNESDLHKWSNVISAEPFISKKGNKMFRVKTYKVRQQLTRLN